MLRFRSNEMANIMHQLAAHSSAFHALLKLLMPTDRFHSYKIRKTWGKQLHVMASRADTKHGNKSNKKIKKMPVHCLNQLIIWKALDSIVFVCVVVCVCVWVEHYQWVEEMTSPFPYKGHKFPQKQCRHVSWSTRMPSTPRLRRRRCCRTPRNSPSASAGTEPAGSPSERQGWNSTSRASWNHVYVIQWWQKWGCRMCFYYCFGEICIYINLVNPSFTYPTFTKTMDLHRYEPSPKRSC